MSVFFFTASASSSANAIASGYTTRPLVYKSTDTFATAYVSYGDTGYRQEHVRSLWGRRLVVDSMVWRVKGLETMCSMLKAWHTK